MGKTHLLPLFCRVGLPAAGYFTYAAMLRYELIRVREGVRASTDRQIWTELGLAARGGPVISVRHQTLPKGWRWMQRRQPN
ncbi:hypothetical protein SAY86_000581 [Trapa natans]|uniref:Uncharacterized protein n=1 Tax=Trapa natans TaxID=22666 RepID=A0AAN7M486_TRANT|nr:hypothetical protein SAY86_000581 [Trapa natans]